MEDIGINKRIRANIIRLRLNAGFTQRVLASKSGVSHIAQIEAGITPAGKGVLLKLAKVLDVDMFEFFLPEEARLIKNDTEKLFHDMIKACQPRSQKFIMEFLLSFIRYEKGRGDSPVL